MLSVDDNTLSCSWKFPLSYTAKKVFFLYLNLIDYLVSYLSSWDRSSLSQLPLMTLRFQNSLFCLHLKPQKTNIFRDHIKVVSRQNLPLCETAKRRNCPLELKEKNSISKVKTRNLFKSPGPVHFHCCLTQFSQFQSFPTTSRLAHEWTYYRADT